MWLLMHFLHGYVLGCQPHIYKYIFLFDFDLFPFNYAHTLSDGYSTVRFWKKPNTSSGSMKIDYWQSLQPNHRQTYLELYRKSKFTALFIVNKIHELIYS
jgi:hypothetical protein